MKKFLWVIAAAVMFAACGDDEDPAPQPEVEKSSEKNIVSFVFEDLSPEVTATIDQSSKVIEAEVSHDTDITALKPTIDISEKATVSPVSGETVDFSEDVVYTVTAEDESTVEYTVKITKSEPPLVLDAIVGGTVRERGTSVQLTGENFIEGEMKVFLLLNDDEFEMTVVAQTEEVITFLISSEIELGDYEIKVTDGNRSVISDEILTVEIESPVIEAVSKTEIIQGEGFVIEGEFFSETNTQVFLGDNELELTSATSTRLEVVVPETVEAAEYTLSVIANGKESFYNAEAIVVIVDPANPVITSINEFSFNRGDTMIITGENLKKDGVATNINFVPFTGGGATVVRSATPNADGTEVSYTLPGDFPTGNYVIVVEVDFNYSNEYDEVIDINP